MFSPTHGHHHPLSQCIREINAIFYDMGFTFTEGPLIETEWYNFDALNVPRDHPARDAQDTFWIKEKGKEGKERTSESLVLRTHTSPVQVRYMEEMKKKDIAPPYRIIVPGQAFRNEATDATHEAAFYQLEGLAVDVKGAVTLAHLKGVLEDFFSKFYRRHITTRFRPGYFPFVEPGVEVDMLFTKKDGTQKWIEVMGAGMVHPSVLRAVHLDPQEYQGFAFGAGIERLAAIKYDIDDVRLFHQGDLRFIHQF